jgi:hypothetical protein
MFIPDTDLDFLPIPNPRPRGQKEHRILNPDPQHCWEGLNFVCLVMTGAVEGERLIIALLTGKPHEDERLIASLSMLLIRIRKDPHHFGNLDPDPYPHPHQIKIRIQIRIKIY